VNDIGHFIAFVGVKCIAAQQIFHHAIRSPWKQNKPILVENRKALGVQKQLRFSIAGLEPELVHANHPKVACQALPNNKLVHLFTCRYKSISVLTIKAAV
jgi:hypothetical protein